MSPPMSSDNQTGTRLDRGLSHGAHKLAGPPYHERLDAAIKELIGAGNQLAALIETTEPYDPGPALDRWDAALDTMIELGGAP